MSMNTSIRVNPYKVNDSSIDNASRHNLPGREAENADPARSHLNRELLSCRNQLDYGTFVKERLDDLVEKGAQNRAIRKDAVGTMELVVRANGAYLDTGTKPDLDIDSWAKDTVNWADRIFNPKNHEISYKDVNGIERTETVQNIYSAVLHLDESTPHIHLMILPIDERGHLNASRYNNFSIVKSLQDSYYKEVGEKHGLERGVKGSPAKATDISRYHTYLNETLSHEAPYHIPGETQQEYDARVTQEIQKCHVHMRDQDLAHESDLNTLRAELNIYKKRHYAINKMFTGDYNKDPDPDLVRTTIRNASTYEAIEKALNECPDKNLAQETTNYLTRVLQLQTENERQIEHEPERLIS